MPDYFKDKNIQPMLLKEQEKPFDDPNYLFEVKFDGMRAIIYVSNTEITIKSRNGKVLNDMFPELLELKKIVKNNCIFDGEIIVMNNNVPDFSKLQERISLKNPQRIMSVSKEQPVTFIVFDILYKDKLLVDKTLMERKKILDNYQNNKYFVKSLYIKNDGIKLFKLTKKNKLEGIIAKRINSTYQIGKRSNDWIKIKHVHDSEFYIGAYKESKDKNVVSLAIGNLVNNKLKYVGKVTIAKKRSEYKAIKSLNMVTNVFEGFADKTYVYIEPKLQCTVEYLTKTKNGHLRHPVFKSLY